MASAGMIVLAEDDPRLRKLYSDTLTAAGYHVLSAGDGLEAIDLLSKVTPKLVLLDIMMPRMNGIDACKRARGIVGDDVPILFLSTLDRLDVLRDCVAAGADDYMIKSNSVKTLVERVKQWTRQSGRGQLADRRKKMVDDVAHETETNAPDTTPPENLSSDNNEDVRVISAFTAEARKLAGESFGTTVEEKLHLIGYVTGVVEYWTETKGSMDKNFNDYLRGVLRETGILTSMEVAEMVTAFDELSKDRNFANGREYGGNDPIKRKRDGDTYIPIGLAAFKDQAA
ncbi:MAG: response regulator transcription factor [Alphaproteobacteria bacterium]